MAEMLAGKRFDPLRDKLPQDWDWSLDEILPVSQSISMRERGQYKPDPDHDRYMEKVDVAMDLRTVPRRLVEAQLGLTGEQADQQLASAVEGYKGGDLTPRQYLSLTPRIYANRMLEQYLAGGDEKSLEVFTQADAQASNPEYVAGVTNSAIDAIKATGGRSGATQSKFAVASLVNALDRSSTGGNYEEEASVPQWVYDRAVEKDPKARLSLMTDAARMNVQRQASSELFRAMQDGDLAPDYAHWFPTAMNKLQSMTWEGPVTDAGRRYQQMTGMPAFRGRAQVALEKWDRSNAENGGPNTLYDQKTGQYTVDDPLTWTGMTQILNSNPQYGVAAAVQPVNSVLGNMGVIADSSNPVRTGMFFADADNRNNRTQPLRLNNQTDQQADQSRLDLRRYNQGSMGYVSASMEPAYSAAKKGIAGIFGGNAQRSFPPPAVSFVPEVANQFPRNAWSLASLAGPSLVMGGPRAAAANMPRVLIPESVQELQEQVAQDSIDTGNPGAVLGGLIEEPKYNAYSRVPAKGLLNREMRPLSPSATDYDKEMESAGDFYRGVVRRGEQDFERSRKATGVSSFGR